VCNQLTQNQNLRDVSSAKVVRDVLCRVYLDVDTPSQSVTVTNNYSGTITGTLAGTITAATASNNVVTFTLNAAPPDTIQSGQFCVISGIGGAPSYNGTGRILSYTTASPYTIIIEMPTAPTGTPTFSGSSQITLYQKIDTISIPQGTWDDRVNGVTPFVLYRQFITPKEIRWDKMMPIANMRFEMYDDMGRSIQDLWESTYAPSSDDGFSFANSFSWNATLLCSEN
jgi:hypothetical protein